MRARKTWLLAVGILLVVLAPLSLYASPLKINYRYVLGGATATGSITFESTLLANPGANTFNLPNPAVLNIDMTVSGAAAGNGHYTTADFSQVRFDTGGATLNLSQQLVGQATPGGAWGTPTGCCGDFNFFGGAAPAPVGVFFFTLGANGGAADAMVLASAAATPAIPTLDQWMLAVLAALLLAVGVAIHRRA